MKKRMIYDVKNHAEGFNKLMDTCCSVGTCAYSALKEGESIEDFLSTKNDFKLIELLCRNFPGFWGISIIMNDNEFIYTTSGGFTFGWTRNYEENYVFVERDFRDGSDLMKSLLSNGFYEDDHKIRKESYLFYY